MRKTKKSFTLVELIIVIAIIAILAVTAFLLLTKWLAKARDGRRISDINTIDYALQLHIIDNPTLPMPENYSTIYDTGFAIARYQGDFTDNVASDINQISRGVKDPDGTYYSYSVTYDFKQYQIKTLTENQISYNNKVYADESYSKIQGNYGGFIITYTGVLHTLWNVPSLFLFSGNMVAGGGLQYVSGNNNFLQNNKSTDNVFFVRMLDVSNLYDTNTGNDAGTFTNIMDAYGDCNGIKDLSSVNYLLKNTVGGINLVTDDSTTQIYSIVGNDSIGRKWENNTYASSCNGYKNPIGNYVYKGDIGDGVYRIDPSGGDNGDKFKVYCDMTTKLGGWTLVMKSSAGNTTFKYSSSYWTDNVLLNDSDLTLNAGVAKYQAYNFVKGKQLMLYQISNKSEAGIISTGSDISVYDFISNDLGTTDNNGYCDDDANLTSIVNSNWTAVGRNGQQCYSYRSGYKYVCSNKRYMSHSARQFKARIHILYCETNGDNGVATAGFGIRNQYAGDTNPSPNNVALFIK